MKYYLFDHEESGHYVGTYLKEEHIKSIVTREQFESVEYRL